jgi:RNA-binding protein
MNRRYTDSGSERRALRARMHAERPAVQVGRGGLEERVIGSAEDAIHARELIKVSFGKGFEGSPQEGAGTLAERLDAEVIEVKGRTAVLFRPAQEEPPGSGEPPTA